jgi:hypothetical protein
MFHIQKLDTLPKKPAETVQATVMRRLSTPRLVRIERPERFASFPTLRTAVTGMFVGASRTNRRWQLVSFRPEALANWLDPALKITQG